MTAAEAGARTLAATARTVKALRPDLSPQEAARIAADIVASNGSTEVAGNAIFANQKAAFDVINGRHATYGEAVRTQNYQAYMTSMPGETEGERIRRAMAAEAFALGSEPTAAPRYRSDVEFDLQIARLKAGDDDASKINRAALMAELAEKTMNGELE